MMLRTLSLAGGLSFAAVTAQFPEFSQQCVQRLGGAVAALDEVVADFDASAAAVGLTREAALAEMTGSAFVARRRADMERTLARHARLSDDLALLARVGPAGRALAASRTDADIARATWAVYQPALPLTVTGVSFAAAGFLGGALVTGGLFSLVQRGVRRLARASA